MTRRTHRSRFLAFAPVTLLCWTLFSSSCWAQTLSEYEPELLQRHFRTIASEYSFQSDDPLKLVETPIMHWSNPARKQEQGSLFVWTANGRPAVLASFFTYFTQRVHLKHELISLSEEPLEATVSDASAWQPAPAMLQWLELPRTLRVPELASHRLIQVRNIARQFEGEKTEHDGTVVGLRLLPRPLLRYRSDDGTIIDGALLAFVEGTDPEIFLIVEAHRKDGGEPRWRCAGIRSHWVELQLRRDGKTVWSKSADPTMRGRKQGEAPWASKPYFTFFPHKELPPPVDLQRDEEVR